MFYSDKPIAVAASSPSLPDTHKRPSIVLYLLNRKRAGFDPFENVFLSLTRSILFPDDTKAGAQIIQSR